MVNPEAYRACLSAHTFSYLRESCQALAEGQHFASAIWGAVFLEALLDDLADLLNLGPPGQADLNGRISQLRGVSQHRGGDSSLAVPDEIVKRCEDIRNTRNRLVHHTGAAKVTLGEDARFINAGLQVILEFYQRVAPRREPEVKAGAGPHLPAVRVYVSAPTPHTPSQEYFIDELLARLRRVGIEPVRLKPTIYDKRDPVGKSRAAIATCRGAIIIGLERTHAYFLRDREGSPKEKEVTHRQYTSGWLQIEAGMANALGLEVFVLCQKEIHNDGIFDRAWNTYPVVELESLDPSSPRLDTFIQHIGAWGEQVRETAADQK